jgi:hypothetical protein
MVIDKNNFKTNNVFVSNDLVKNITFNIENKEIIVNLLDTYDNLGDYSIKFIDVLSYNMTSFDFMEDNISVYDFYLSLETGKYDSFSKYENIELNEYVEFVIEFNNDDFIKIFCRHIDVDNKKVITMM